MSIEYDDEGMVVEYLDEYVPILKKTSKRCIPIESSIQTNTNLSIITPTQLQNSIQNPDHTLDSNAILENELNNILKPTTILKQQVKNDVFETLGQFGIMLKTDNDSEEMEKINTNELEEQEMINKIVNQLDNINDQIGNITFVKNKVMRLLLNQFTTKLTLDIPIDSSEKLYELEKLLQNAKHRNPMINIAKLFKPQPKIGGGYRYGLKAIINEDVLQAFTWWGDENHLCFEEFKNLNDLLFECWKDDQITSIQDYSNIISDQLDFVNIL